MSQEALGKTTTADFPAIGLDRFQAEVGRWADATFPASTPISKARHLLREAGEVCELSAVIDFAGAMPAALEPVREAVEAELLPQLADECADALLLLLHIAHAEGFSLLGAARRKFTENQLRTWLQPDTQGVVEHDRSE
jgi:NTP pyrophosphatase (non-canonical NTP hydrolase)